MIVASAYVILVVIASSILWSYFNCECSNPKIIVLEVVTAFIIMNSHHEYSHKYTTISFTISSVMEFTTGIAMTCGCYSQLQLHTEICVMVIIVVFIMVSGHPEYSHKCHYKYDRNSATLHYHLSLRLQ
jgi:hypothetical protein